MLTANMHRLTAAYLSDVTMTRNCNSNSINDYVGPYVNMFIFRKKKLEAKKREENFTNLTK